MQVPFNKPFVAGKELFYIAQAVTKGQLSGDGFFSTACAELLQERLSIEEVLLTPSCTAALEMGAMLCGLSEGDEVIMPSYTFVSTALAVTRLNAVPVFVDIRPDTLNIDEQQVAEAISPRTKAIFPVHYAGVGCMMDSIMEIAREHNLIVVEDAAQAVNCRYKGKPLGSFGHLSCFSFHETKNYICGEGGALGINDAKLIERARILRDKGTNRRQFMVGDVDKYTWVDTGSSYVISEVCSAFLYGQLEEMDAIAAQRRRLFETYTKAFQDLARMGDVLLPSVPASCQPNGHLFYLLLQSQDHRDGLIKYLKTRGIHAVFHYVPLHLSPMGSRSGRIHGSLSVTEEMAARLVRLPMFYDLSENEQNYTIECVHEYLRGARV